MIKRQLSEIELGDDFTVEMEMFRRKSFQSRQLKTMSRDQEDNQCRNHE